MSSVIHHAFSASSKHGETLVRAYADTLENNDEGLEISAVVMNVARVSKMAQRHTILRSLIAKKKAEYIIQNTGGMAPDDAKSVMLDFFKSGGSTGAVASWLRAPG